MHALGTFSVLAPFTLCASAAFAQPSNWHLVRIDGDLDTTRTAQRLDETLDELEKKKPSLIVLELRGNNARPDVLWRCARAVKECAVPVTVYLSDPDDRTVGTAQAALGVFATRCYVDSGTAVRSGTESLNHLAPADTPWAAIVEETTDWFSKRAHARSADPLLGEAFIRPTRALWVSKNSAPQASILTDAGAAETPLVTKRREAGWDVVCSAEDLVRLKAANGTVPNAARAARLSGAASLPKTQSVINADLGTAGARVADRLTSCDAALDEAQASLDLPDPATRSIATARYKDAARAALAKLAAGQQAVQEAEATLAEYPELLREPAPGQTGVGATPSSTVARWRSLIQSRRNRLNSLAEDAASFQALPD
jgi:hypothetical protein